MADQSAKKTKGKQAIEIKKIESENDRMVTFSKRKSGICKKANELAVLTGAQVGFLVFSPCGKPYAFGHPSFADVSNRLFGLNVESNDVSRHIVEAHRQVKISSMNQYYNELRAKLDGEREREKVIEEMTKGRKIDGWWKTPVNSLSVEELERLDGLFDELRDMLHEKLSKIKHARGEGSSSTPSFAHMEI